MAREKIKKQEKQYESNPATVNSTASSGASTLDDRQYQNPDIKGKNPNALTPEQEKEMQKVREELDSLKQYILDTHKAVNGIGIIPPQAADMFDEENELTEEEKKEKPMHLVVILPDDKEKEFTAIRNDILKKIKESKQKIWLNLFLEKDIWDIAMDSKYDLVEAIGMAFPLHDKGILGALRVAQIHKSLCLKKFEKYVYSYVIWGSIARGEAVKTSDVDVGVIIDDTDVKRMPRLELKEKLRNIIYSYVMQAEELAGVKNKLSPNIYLLTEFWEGVKDANPIFYGFLRDGVPLYDRGGFLPWKLLLRMGKIKPTPESIDLFMSAGDKTTDIVKRRLLDIVLGDIYWGVITPAQAMLMLYGLPPPNVKETVPEFKRVFVDKEKMIEKKYADILEEIVLKYYKGYEHGKIKEVSGKDVDRLLKDSEDFLKRLKVLREEIEKRMQKNTFEDIYSNVFKLMKALFGDKDETELIRDYEKEIINKGKGNPKYIHTLNELINVKKEYKNRKAPAKYVFENLRKETVYLIEDLIEYAQRKELGLLEKTKVILSFNNKHAELFLTNPAFLVFENKVKRITDKIEDSDANELNSILASYKGNRVRIDSKMLSLLKKELGEFDIHL
jgi:predicted nucleotidyltransferase